MDAKLVNTAFGLFTGGSGPLNYGTQGELETFLSIITTQDQVSLQKLMENKRAEQEVFKFSDPEYQRIMELLIKDIKIKPVEYGVAIELSNYILFNEGESEIRPENLPLLQRLGEVIRVARQYPISIEGHTDGSPIEGGQTDFAWQLSLARAINVLEFLIESEGIKSGRFRVGGYGPSKPAYPVDEPDSRAKNRRIEIILYREQFG